MATKVVEKEEGKPQATKNLDIWRYPKVPVQQIYMQKAFRLFPSYTIREYERTITLESANKVFIVDLLNKDFLKGFVKKQHKFLHLGLVQIAIKPLIRAGLGAPILVCVRDARHVNFNSSLLALVETNLFEGPFFFNCFPSFAISTANSLSHVLSLKIVTGGIPVALACRLVCKAMVDLNAESLKEVVLGETTYFHGSCGTAKTTIWDEVEVPENWTKKAEA